MRIVGGIYRGRRFYPPKNFEARPTTDFAKENIFNVLNHRILWEQCSALDLFAGTGSIGFECVSRGCCQVVSVEKNPLHTQFIRSVEKQLKIDNMRIYTADAFRFIASCKSQFDLIFCDPPYNHPQIETLPELIIEKNMLSNGGVLVMEHSKNNQFDHLPLFVEKRTYGSVNFSIFEKPE